MAAKRAPLLYKSMVFNIYFPPVYVLSASNSHIHVDDFIPSSLTNFRSILVKFNLHISKMAAYLQMFLFVL